MNTWVTRTIWTRRNTQAPPRAQYSHPVWKVSRWGTCSIVGQLLRSLDIFKQI